MAKPNPSEPEISQVLLERYYLGEITDGEKRRVEARLQRDVDLQARLQALVDSNAEILSAQPPIDFVRRLTIRQDADQRRLLAAREAKADSHNPLLPSPLGWGKTALALGVTLGLSLIGTLTWFTIPHDPSHSQMALVTDAEGETRLKGLMPKLVLFRKTGEGSEALTQGAIAHAGESLRVGYQPAGSRFGAILSVDGNGQVTQHWPQSGHQASSLANAETLLPTAYELDNAPRFERFFFITDSMPFELNSWIENLKAHHELSQPIDTQKSHSSLRLARFEILKANP